MSKYILCRIVIIISYMRNHMEVANQKYAQLGLFDWKL